MQIRVLGHFEASVDDHPVALGGAKQRAVLAMLGLEANRTVLPALENVQFAAFDVHPQQAPCRRVPTWSFRELCVRAYGDLHGGRIA